MSANLTPVPDSQDNAVVAPLRPALVQYFLRKCGNAAEAEDLAQDVLVRALSKSKWDSPEQAKGYIFRIAVNRWHDRNRRILTHGTVVEWDDEEAFALGEESSPERVLSNEQELHAVVAALQELNERTRDVFMLFRLEHLKHGEIAQLFGMSVSAVEKHVCKAAAHLARRAASANRTS
ncbi:MAG TPA: RNA polymerase sigma factor [Steroidobacteraceae bacterium]|jgi:RNA polymerase sigma factor (sigma-70 family)|nr:RNA polymerase sigma factor [Steroidobacteraceae bacterium]